jgi:hypothetical protein
MGVMLDMARAVLPRRAKRYLRERWQRALLDNGMERLARSDPLARTGLSSSLARQLIVGWANENMSAGEEFLQAIFRHAGEAKGPILECGSGLSTLVLGIAARRSGQRVWSLENDPFWVSVVQSALNRFQIDNVKVCQAPLRNYGRFEWYDPPREQLAAGFALVICDGPQGTTRGGRYGLMPVLGSHLRKGCMILLDDAARDDGRRLRRTGQDDGDRVTGLDPQADRYHASPSRL